MLSVPAIELAELNKTIDLVLMRTNNYKEVLFWKALQKKCKINTLSK